MATTLLSNLLYSSSYDNENDNGIVTDRRDKNVPSDRERRQIVALLKATTKCIEEGGTSDAVIYEAMGALHRYTAMSAGLVPPNPMGATDQERQPAFVDGLHRTGKHPFHEDTLAYGWVDELSSSSSSCSSSKGNDDDTEEDASKPSADVEWNSVLAILVKTETDEEPCLWITKEVLANQFDEDRETEDGGDDDGEHRDEIVTRGAANRATELETLHSIPLRRRLRSCGYQNFYGDHRVVLELKHLGGAAAAKKRRGKHPPPPIVLRCPSEASARAWVDRILKSKKQVHMDATNANIELEMVASGSTEFGEGDGDGNGDDPKHRTRIINVIDSEDEDDEDYGVSTTETNAPRLAERLQEAADRKKALKLAVKEAAALERAREEEERRAREQRAAEEARARELEARQTAERRAAEEKAVTERKKEAELQRTRLASIEKNVESIVELEKKREQQQRQAPRPPAAAPKPPMPRTAAEKQQLRMEREIAARKRAEEERRRIEIEYEQKKKERVEQRRRDLEAQRKAAREEQKRKELRQKQRFLENEQRKEAMKATAAAKMAAPKKVISGVFGKKPVAIPSKETATAKPVDTTTDGAKDEKKGDLWFTLGKQMSAFEASDDERKRREAEKREEEIAKAAAEQEEDDPELVRKRIAEEARQRLVQEEAGKRMTEAGTFKNQQQAETVKRGVSDNAFQQQPPGQTPTNGWAGTKQQATSSPAGAAANATGTTTTSPPMQLNPTGSSVLANHIPHGQSWKPMHQPSPSYPANTPFQQQHQQTPPGGVPYQPSGAVPPSYKPQQHQQQPTPGYPVPPYPSRPMKQQPTPSSQPQMHAPRPQQAPHPARHQHPANPQHQATHTHATTTTQPPPAPRSAPPSATPSAPPPAASQASLPEGEFTGSALKKTVLVNWGLQPPAMQVLKPVDQLLCTIHGVFPPAFGVPSHDYFNGWKPVGRSELVEAASGILEESKLKKTVRKVRFFLHPDKLPHDLTEEQRFLCKLLWDVINDAFEEYKKSREELDWM